MSASREIRTVAVVGGGLTAWSAAAALKRRIPLLDVQLIQTAPADDALADRMISTLPSIHGFHRDIGLTDVDTIERAASGVRLGTLFEGWSSERPDYVHAYAPCGAPLDGIAFHQLWLRDRLEQSLPPFDRLSAGGELARLGTLPDRSSEPIEFGLQLTLQRYQAMMEAYTRHVGVAVRAGTVAEVQLRTEDGFIEAILLGTGERVTADLFVDCTGPAALLHRRLDERFIEWKGYLLCDSVVQRAGSADATAELMDRATARSFGWAWRSSSPSWSSAGLVYSSRHGSPEELDRQFATGATTIRLNQGRRADFWVRNCVAIGDAAAIIEPLEWTNLHLVHSQLDRLVAMMPGSDCAPVEIAQFNRECGAEADRVLDFLCLHYICTQRPEPFWKDAAAVTPPPSLQHTLSLFKERGRLPYYQEETFSRDSWVTVLLGQGVEPRRIDPITDIVPPDEAGRAFAAVRQSLKSLTLRERSSQGTR